MPVSQYGDLNTTALIVPDLYVQIVPPQTVYINGLPTNILGIVGTASWGPVNAPATFGSMASYAQLFGPVKNRKYDMGTIAATAVQQGANNFRGVRVTDGTDVAATSLIQKGTPTVSAGGTGYAVNDTITLSNGAIVKVLTVSTGAVATVSVLTEPSAATAGSITQTATSGSGAGATFTFVYATGVTITSKYTGSLANGDSVTIAAGSQASTYKVTVSRAGTLPEVFDNIAGSGNALWVAIAAAINEGVSGIRSKSELVTAAAGAATAAPTLGTYTLASGTDGSEIAVSDLVGEDTTPRTGMYALRGTFASIGVLSDADDSTTWASQVAFGLSEGMYMIGTGPAGDTISNAASTKASAGIDSYAFKLMHGDWIYWLDTVNGATRLVSPQGFIAGRLANLSPEQSSLNKPIYGVVGTQKSSVSQIYDGAELQQLGQAGIDLITNPVPGGSYFGARFGHNSSSNAVINGDNYSRMTNYIAYTLNGAMGQFVGKLQGRTDADPTRRAAKATLDAWLGNLQAPNPLTGYGMIDDFQNILDRSNNTDSRIALGYMQDDTKVVYLGIVEKFLVNVEGGVSVQITRQSTAPAA